MGVCSADSRRFGQLLFSVSPVLPVSLPSNSLVSCYHHDSHGFHCCHHYFSHYFILTSEQRLQTPHPSPLNLPFLHFCVWIKWHVLCTVLPR
uniref:Uncharacterized protein n=1 Tax=Anguilla anguilla TaxID=7936 RepID=A0A0E9WAP2_ANGAN